MMWAWKLVGTMELPETTDWNIFGDTICTLVNEMFGTWEVYSLKLTNPVSHGGTSYYDQTQNWFYQDKDHGAHQSLVNSIRTEEVKIRTSKNVWNETVGKPNHDAIKIDNVEKVRCNWERRADNQILAGPQWSWVNNQI